MWIVCCFGLGQVRCLSQGSLHVHCTSSGDVINSFISSFLYLCLESGTWRHLRSGIAGALRTPCFRGRSVRYSMCCTVCSTWRLRAPASRGATGL